jgi:acyl-coenzyme A synthetase/AMP-(fatty) acid ligase
MGIKPGDRVGILLPQRPKTAIAHLAVYKLGAVAVPLFVQFGPDAIEHRLTDSAARALITDGENLAKIPHLKRLTRHIEVGHLNRLTPRTDIWSRRCMMVRPTDTERVVAVGRDGGFPAKDEFPGMRLPLAFPYQLR